MAAQVPDIIIIDGERRELYSNPLEPYWAHHDIKRPEFVSTVTCKRGYIATWEVIDRFLLLRDVEGYIKKQNAIFQNKVESFSMNMFLNKVSVSSVIANWFNGKIRVPLGKRTFYVHEGYASRFEKDMVITIECGNVLKTVILDYAEHTLEIVV